MVFCWTISKIDLQFSHPPPPPHRHHSDHRKELYPNNLAMMLGPIHPRSHLGVTSRGKWGTHGNIVSLTMIEKLLDWENMMQCFFFLPHTRDDDIRHSSMYDQIQCTCASKVRKELHFTGCIARYVICSVHSFPYGHGSPATHVKPSVSLLDKMAACVCSVVQLEFNFGAAGIVL